MSWCATVAEAAFGVETVVLDLPPLVGALGRRLHDAGVPMTPARAADLARALTLVRPVSRRRLYWTARAVLVSDPGQVKAFDAVFWAIFGDGAPDEPVELDDVRTVPAPAAARPAAERRIVAGQGASATPGESGEDGEEVDVPLALASD